MRDMFHFLKNLKGNAKSSLLTEPLWGIPFNLYAPFATLYMFHLGVLDAQIGLLLALGRLLQMFTSMLGGVLTDKFGRRLTTFIVDFVSWSIPALIWAFSQNFWWFLAAAMVNSLFQITAVSWECLWVDEVGEDAEKLSKIFNWIYIAGQLAVFFAPITGFLLGRYSLVPVMRALYIFAFISMTAKFVILYIYSKETERGLERMRETKSIPFTKMFLGYKEVFVQISKSRKMVRALALQALFGVTFLVSTTFFSLYATQNLGLPEPFLAYFPILRAVIMLAFLFAIQNKLSIFKQQNVMLAGIVVFIAAHGLLLASPPGNIVLLAFYTVIEACAIALLMPRLDTLAANSIDPRERARIRSTFNMIILAVSSPFAYLAGELSDTDRRLPFVLNIGLFAIMALIIIVMRRPGKEAAQEI